VCTVRELLPGGDHTIAIGEVVSMGLAEGEPLVWYRGAYRRLGGPPGAADGRRGGAIHGQSSGAGHGPAGDPPAGLAPGGRG
jgi:hypothetical protein